MAKSRVVDEQQTCQQDTSRGGQQNHPAYRGRAPQGHDFSKGTQQVLVQRIGQRVLNRGSQPTFQLRLCQGRPRCPEHALALPGQFGRHAGRVRQQVYIRRQRDLPVPLVGPLGVIDVRRF